MTSFDVRFTGPGSQPPDGDGAALDFMSMPSGMRTFSVPSLPEPDEVSGVETALAALDEVLATLGGWRDDGAVRRLSLHALDEASRRFVDEVLGEGEVSIVGADGLQVQESVLAGVWRVQRRAGGVLLDDAVEVAHFPAAALAQAAGVPLTVVATASARKPAGVVNAAALLTELADRVPLRAGSEPHVINLTLLPLTEPDLDYLAMQLGHGNLSVLSRGYGNCRIEATATRAIWRVRYFNSEDALILDTLEVSEVPAVACAAPEDIADSAARLAQILAVYR